MFKKFLLLNLLVLFTLLFLSSAQALEVSVSKSAADLSKLPIDEKIWEGVHEETVSLLAQPMAIPRPKTVSTSTVKVKALQNGDWIAFKMTWADSEISEAGKLGKFSDAIAIQFPIIDGPPPPIFMGGKDQPVHIFHWRAQYQRDSEKGKPEMTDLYPNMNPDMYPMEFKDSGSIKGLSEEKREVYSQGKAAGNPQSYKKLSSVDEIFAEGFGSSSVIENNMSIGHGVWKNGQWSVIISRPLKRENGSILLPSKNNFVAFAVWQGGKDEVGSRKSLTMSWIPLKLADNGIRK